LKIIIEGEPKEIAAFEMALKGGGKSGYTTLEIDGANIAKLSSQDQTNKFSASDVLAKLTPSCCCVRIKH
jgi:hypothetical protein